MLKYIESALLGEGLCTDKTYVVYWTHTRVKKEEGTSSEELPPSDFPMDKSVDIFLNNDSCERAQSTVFDVTFKQVVLDCIKSNKDVQALNMPRPIFWFYFPSNVKFPISLCVFMLMDFSPNILYK